jgi:hypothetical protein
MFAHLTVALGWHDIARHILREGLNRVKALLHVGTEHAKLAAKVLAHPLGCLVLASLCEPEGNKCKHSHLRDEGLG